MKITLTEALAKLKMYNKKVQKLLSTVDNNNFVDYIQGTDKKCKITGLIPDAFKKEVQSNFDKIVALMQNKNRLKAAIAQTNAITKVKVGDKEYTIVQAIERKNALPEEKEMLDVLKYQLSKVKEKVEDLNQKAQEKANNIVESQVQAEAKNKKTEEIEALYNLIYSKNKAELVDPLNLEKLIQEKENEIEEFEQNIDVALSIVNANTLIEVDLD